MIVSKKFLGIFSIFKSYLFIIGFEVYCYGIGYIFERNDFKMKLGFEIHVGVVSTEKTDVEVDIFLDGVVIGKFEGGEKGLGVEDDGEEEDEVGVLGYHEIKLLFG